MKPDIHNNLLQLFVVCHIAIDFTCVCAVCGADCRKMRLSNCYHRPPAPPPPDLPPPKPPPEKPPPPPTEEEPPAAFAAGHSQSEAEPRGL